MSWLTTRAALDTSWYRLINFVGARILQAKELDDFQGTIVHKAHNTVSAIFNEGGLMNVKATVSGLSVALEPVDASKPMLCFMAGGFEQISPITLTFPAGKASGTDYIFLNYVIWRVTADGTYDGQPGCLVDPNLIDIATNEPVSERGQLQYEISLDARSGCKSLHNDRRRRLTSR